MKFSVTKFRDELADLRIPKGVAAFVLRVPPNYVSRYLKSVLVPSDAVVRRMFALFTIVRGANMTNGGLKFDAKTVNAIRKQLDEMERSIVRSARTINDDREESKKCHAVN